MGGGKLDNQATHEASPDLANRGHFSRHLVGALKDRGEQDGPPVAVLCIEVDDLRMVSNTLGPCAGDLLLVELAERLRACIRPTDTAARMEGDEFAVLIPEVHSSELLVDVADRIARSLGDPAGVGDGVGVRSAVSLGVAIADHTDITADELLRRGQVAMHTAKAGGKGLVGVFGPSLQVVLERPRADPAGGSDPASSAQGRDDVRLWLARELHDGALQTLTTMLLDMEEVRRGVPESAESHHMPGFQASVRTVIGGLRHILGDLRHQSGEDHRLVEDLAGLLGQLDDRAGIKGHISVSPAWPSSLSAHIASNLRRIAEEALRNVALHSGAERVMVSLEVEEENLILTVSDDGHGCREACPKGTGMLGMEERALLLGGRLEVLCDPGEGTTVRGTFSPARTA